MKYNIIYSLLAILSSLSVVICQEDFYTCKRVCEEEFLEKLDDLLYIDRRGPADFKAILPYWKECQYRCHRCYLVDSIKRMDDLQSMFDNEQYHDSTGARTIGRCFYAIKHDLKWTCYNPWLFAIRDNDSTSKF